MTGNEARKMLKTAGFHRVRTGNDGHEHWGLGKHRIMISPGPQELRPSDELRIKKLCRGDLTSRDIARETHQRKRESPSSLFKVGDSVCSITTGTERVGVISDIDYQHDKAAVDWGANGESDIQFNIDLKFLRLAYPEPPEVKPSKEVVMQEDSGEGVPEGVPIEQRGEPKYTLLEQLGLLGMAAEDEYGRLIAFHNDVVAYNRIFDLQEQLGIEVKPLPFKLIDGVEQPVVSSVEVMESAPPLAVSRTKLGKKQSHPAAKIVSTNRIIDLLKENRGKMSRSAVVMKFGWTRKDQTLEALDKLMAEDYITVAQLSTTGRGSWEVALTTVGWA